MFKIKSSDTIDCKYYILTESKLYYTAAESSPYLQGEMCLRNVLMETFSPVDLKDAEKMDITLQSIEEENQLTKAVASPLRVEKKLDELQPSESEDAESKAKPGPTLSSPPKIAASTYNNVFNKRNLVRPHELAGILGKVIRKKQKHARNDKQQNKPKLTAVSGNLQLHQFSNLTDQFSGQLAAVDISKMFRLRFTKGTCFCEIGTLISENFLILSQMLRKLCICTGFIQEYKIDKLLVSWRGGDDHLITCISLRNDDLKVARMYLKHNLTVPHNLHQLKSTITCLQKLKHPLVLKLEHVYEDATRIYLLCEHVQGPNIEKTMKMKFEFSETDLKFFFRGLVETLSFIHSRGYVHRSISSRTIMLKSSGIPGKDENLGVIVGFKFAAALEDTALLANLCGEPGFIAPEIASGRYDPNSIDFCKVDVFALGVAIYFLLTGEKPFVLPEQHESEEQEYFVLPGTFYMIRRAPNQRYKTYSSGVRNLVSNMLCLDPQSRYSTLDILNSDYFNGRSVAGSKLVNHIRGSRRPSLVDSSLSQTDRQVVANTFELNSLRGGHDKHVFRPETSGGSLTLQKFPSEMAGDRGKPARPQLKSIDDYALAQTSKKDRSILKSAFCKSALKQPILHQVLNSRSDEAINMGPNTLRLQAKLESKSLNELVNVGNETSFKNQIPQKLSVSVGKSGPRFESEMVQKAIVKLGISPPQLRKSIIASESKRWDGLRLVRMSAEHRASQSSPHDCEEGCRPNAVRTSATKRLMDLNSSSRDFKSQQEVDRINLACQVPNPKRDRLALRIRVPLQPKSLKGLSSTVL